MKGSNACLHTLKSPSSVFILIYLQFKEQLQLNGNIILITCNIKIIYIYIFFKTLLSSSYKSGVILKWVSLIGSKLPLLAKIMALRL